jgi:hypothetical protein
MRSSGFVLLGAVLAVLAAGILSSGWPEPPDVPAVPRAPPSGRPHRSKESVGRPSPVQFVDVTDALGLDFVSFSGSTPDKHLPTGNGTGVAMIDYDQDGWMDLYFANACRLKGPQDGPPNAMFRSRRGELFQQIVEKSGTDVTGFTQGLTAADFNNDGFPDLYLIRLGHDILLENNGDGTFHDSSVSSGLDDPRWGTSAAFLDFDEDGNLDAYVANYVQWNLQRHDEHFCGQRIPLVKIYCSPTLFTPETHGLFRSQGDGTFLDVAAELGIARRDGRGQGVVACDVNNDGHVDLYVANDLSPKFLFINSGAGGFRDMTEASWAAYNSDGKVEASMGVDAADVDGDGFPDLFVTNYYLEHNTLFRNLGKDKKILFQDFSHAAGVAAGSLLALGWGTAFEDLDGDGWLDIFVVNGHVDDNMPQLGRDEPYAQPARIWRNVAKGRFEMFGVEAGTYLGTEHVSRGAAFGDLDNDGQVDVVISHKDEHATVLRNDSREQIRSGNSWIQFTLVGTRSNRDVIGARVQIDMGERRLTRHTRGGRSYLSAHDPRLTIGLGKAERIDRVTVYWPTGQVTSLEDVNSNRSYTLREPIQTSSPE